MYKNGRNGRVGYRKKDCKQPLTIRIKPKAKTAFRQINEKNGKGSAIALIEEVLIKNS